MCPMSCKALEIASGFSTNAVRLLVDAKCPISSDAIKIASGFSQDAVELLLKGKFYSNFRRIVYNKILLDFCFDNLNIENDVIEYLFKNYLSN